MPIICTLHRDGRTIVKSTVSQVVQAGAQGLYLTVTFPELRTVEQIMHIEVTTSPKTWILTAGLMQDKTYLGNVVGISLKIDSLAGTTLSAEVLAIGF
ncbi:hypothetical protein MUP01_07590 [Candidatus Bathyarchaeota archaeon]|nr:hypothetical protein [Candidatus Bathyarchaeota archaeon]